MWPRGARPGSITTVGRSGTEVGSSVSSATSAVGSGDEAPRRTPAIPSSEGIPPPSDLSAAGNLFRRGRSLMTTMDVARSRAYRGRKAGIRADEDESFSRPLMALRGETWAKAVPDVDRTVAPTPTLAAAPVLTKSLLLTAFSPRGFRSFRALSRVLAMSSPHFKPRFSLPTADADAFYAWRRQPGHERPARTPPKSAD